MHRGGVERVQIHVRDLRPSRGHCAARNSRPQGAARVLDCAPPALRAADGLDRASRDPCPGNYRRPEWKCLTTAGGGATVGSSWLAALGSPLCIARCGARSNRRSQTTVRSLILNSLPGCLFVRRHVRESTTESDCASVPGQAQIRPYMTRLIITLPRRYACQKSMRREMRSARPTVNNSGIDARNGQAYHGRKTIATNGTRPASLDSRSGERQRVQWQQHRRVASRVRSGPGAAGRTRVLRVGVEAAAANDSVRCLK